MVNSQSKNLSRDRSYTRLFGKDYMKGIEEFRRKFEGEQKSQEDLWGRFEREG